MADSVVEVVTKAYEAFGRGDVPSILALVAEQVDWRFCGPKALPYTGSFRTRAEVGRFFSLVGDVDDIRKFEPREFIPAGDKLTVLGWEQTAAKPGGRVFDSEWIHVFTVRDGKIV